MKNFTLLVFTMLSFGLFAQNNSLNVFSQDGDPFFLIVNGVKQNTQPGTNVTADNLNKDIMYKIKVVFADGVTPDADKTIFFEKNNQLMTAAIDKVYKKDKLKKVKLRYAGLTDKESNTGSTETYTQNNTGNSNQNTNYNNSNTVGNSNSGNSETYNNGNSNSTTTTTTTNTTTTNNGNGGSVNVNMTDPATGENVSVGIDVNISGTGTGTNTTTTSSTTSSSSTTTTTSNTNYNNNYDNSNNQYDNTGYNDDVPTYVPGYEGTVGCNNVLVNESEILSAIDDESFSDDKMMILKQATKTKCVSADQVVSFIGKFDFEKDQVEAAKFLYEKTYDQDNYFKVISALEFSSSKEELKEYIDNSRVDNSGYNSNVPTYVPGYTGSIGCNNILINESDIKEAIQEESFSDDKMAILDQATKTKCVSTDQVLSLMEEFSFDDDKLEVAKKLYDKTYDQDNYFKVINSFDFSSTKEELNEYIEGR